MSFIKLEELKNLDTSTEEIRIACILCALKESWDTFDELGFLKESDDDYIICSDAQGVLERDFGITVSDEEILTCLRVVADMIELDVD